VRAPTEDSGDSGGLERDLLAQRLEELRSDEEALDPRVGLDQRERLIHHVVLVGLGHLDPPLLDALDDPPRVQIEEEADAAAHLGEVLHREAQAAGPGGPHR
jgi:hypothetical protein